MPGDLHSCVANFCIQKITVTGLSQKLLSAEMDHTSFCLPSLEMHGHFFLEAVSARLMWIHGTAIWC